MPLVAIGAAFAAVVAVRREHRGAGIAWGIAALVAAGACAWIYVFVFNQPSA